LVLQLRDTFFLILPGISARSVPHQGVRCDTSHSRKINSLLCDGKRLIDVRRFRFLFTSAKDWHWNAALIVMTVRLVGTIDLGSFDRQGGQGI